LRAALLAALALLVASAARAETPQQFWTDPANAAPPFQTIPSNFRGLLGERRFHAGEIRERVKSARLATRDGATLDGASAPPALIAEAARWLGSGNMTGRPGAWCAWAVSFWLERTGHRPLANGLAASALSYGPHLASPRVGALAVMSTRRGRAHHVGIVTGIFADAVEIISGNWGRRVARALVPLSAIDAFIGVS
jgi:uncharacterized protein (TIGR02594 family)